MRMKGLRLTDQGQVQLCQRRPSGSRKAFLLQVRQERDIGCEMPTGFRFCSATFDRGSIEMYSLIGEIEAHLTLMSLIEINLGSPCHTVLLEEDSPASCQEQCNICKHGTTTPGPANSMQTSSMPTLSRAADTSCNDCMDVNISLDTESLCSACSAVCSPSDGHFCAVCHSHVRECSRPSSVPLAVLPSWSLKWCPRRIGNNPNRHFNLSNFTFYLSQAKEIPTMLLPPSNPKTQGQTLGVSSQVQTGIGMNQICFMDI